MPDMTNWTTAMKEAYKVAQARQNSKRGSKQYPGARGYFIQHRWLPKSMRRKA